MPSIQMLATLEGDHRAEFPDCNVNHYFVHIYGTCCQCSSPIQLPGLDHSYCSGCKDWILSRSIRNSAIEISDSSPIPPRPPSQALPRPESKSAVTAQLDLWGGVA